MPNETLPVHLTCLWEYLDVDVDVDVDESSFISDPDKVSTELVQS